MTCTGTTAFAAVVACLATSPQYRVVDVGEPAPNGCFCTSRAVNATGQVAGFFFGADNDYNGFFANGTEVIDISPPGENRTQGLGINDAGLVVGWTNAFDLLQSPILYDGDTVIDLGTYGGRFGTARDINNAGDIVGCATTPLPDEHDHATVWRDGELIDLGTLGGPISDATAISETGFIAGWSWNVDWDRRPVFWTPDLQGPFELPTFSPPGMLAMATAVNDLGHVVGEVQVESPLEVRFRAALWVDGEVSDLGLLDEAGEGTSLFQTPAMMSTRATGINSAGVIVGNSEPPAVEPEERHGPFVYRNGQMTNLNNLLHASAAGWMVTGAQAINDDGVIAADAEFNDGDRKSVLLVPVTSGDIDGDGDVDTVDFLALLASWGPCTDCVADLDGNGVVDTVDLLALLAAWGGG